MIEELIQFDHKLFFLINNSMTNPFFDWIMPLLRNKYFWSPLYLFLVVFFIRDYGRQGYVIILFLLLTFAFADMSSSGLIKPIAKRLRPCNDPEITQLISRANCGSGFSFPSSHAANHFAIAMFLSTVFFKRWKWITAIAIVWAASISFAQVYVGVHFPLDVLAGGLLGSMIGYITGTIVLVIQPKKIWHSGN